MAQDYRKDPIYNRAAADLDQMRTLLSKALHLLKKERVGEILDELERDLHHSSDMAERFMANAALVGIWHTMISDVEIEAAEGGG